jgi:hypothetical protein
MYTKRRLITCARFGCVPLESKLLSWASFHGALAYKVLYVCLRYKVLYVYLHTRYLQLRLYFRSNYTGMEASSCS